MPGRSKSRASSTCIQRAGKLPEENLHSLDQVYRALLEPVWPGSGEAAGASVTHRLLHDSRLPSYKQISKQQGEVINKQTAA